MNGAESVFKAGGQSHLKATGQVNINATQAKALLELSCTDLKGDSGVKVSFDSEESNMVMLDLNLDGGTGDAVRQAGTSSTSNKSAIKLSNVVGKAAGDLRISSALNASEGNVNIEKSAFYYGPGSINIVTGGIGKTEVSGNILYSNNSYTSQTAHVRVATGTGGVCVAGSNTLSTPIAQICQ